MTFHMKAVGVTFGDRQRAIARLRVGQPLRFVPEPENAYDNTAVRIETLDGTQVGYVPKEKNSDIFYNIRMNKATYNVKVANVTGGGFGTAYGLNIEIDVVFKNSRW